MASKGTLVASLAVLAWAAFVLVAGAFAALSPRRIDLLVSFSLSVCSALLLAFLSARRHASATLVASIAQAAAGVPAARALCASWADLSVFHKVYCFASVVPLVVFGNVVISFLVGILATGVLYPASYSPIARFFHRRISFANKHVIITGGGAGLGKAMAEIFACRGSKVTIIARNKATLESVCSDISSKCHRPDDVGFAVADVTCPEAVEAAIAQAVRERGPPGLLICNAGIAHPGYFMDTPASVFSSQMNLNYGGQINALRYCLPLMKPGSHVMLVGSMLSLLGAMGYTQYAASKFATRGLAESLRLELAQAGIGVSIFYPPNMKTAGYEIEERTKPQEARVIDQTTATISAEQAAEVCINSLEDGEFSLAASWLDDLTRMSCNGLTPSPRPMIEFLMAPLWWLATGLVRKDWEATIAKFGEQKRKSSPECSPICTPALVEH